MSLSFFDLTGVMVRLASDGVGTARSPSAYVTFATWLMTIENEINRLSELVTKVAYPYAHTVDPNEGPVEGAWDGVCALDTI